MNKKTTPGLKIITINRKASFNYFFKEIFEAGIVLKGSEIKSKTNLSGPHTVHCLGSEIIISFLGNAKGEAPGGYLHLNKNFSLQLI